MWIHLYCVTVISIVCNYNMVETTETVTTYSQRSLQPHEGRKRKTRSLKPMISENVTCYEWKTNEQKSKQGVLTLEMSMWLTVRLGVTFGLRLQSEYELASTPCRKTVHNGMGAATREQPHNWKSQNGTVIKGDWRNKQGVLWPLLFIMWNCTDVDGEALAYLKWQSDGI